jgi:hypothetical protein
VCLCPKGKGKGKCGAGGGNRQHKPHQLLLVWVCCTRKGARLCILFLRGRREDEGGNRERERAGTKKRERVRHRWRKHTSNFDSAALLRSRLSATKEDTPPKARTAHHTNH